MMMLSGRAEAVAVVAAQVFHRLVLSIISSHLVWDGKRVTHIWINISEESIEIYSIFPVHFN